MTIETPPNTIETYPAIINAALEHIKQKCNDALEKAKRIYDEEKVQAKIESETHYKQLIAGIDNKLSPRERGEAEQRAKRESNQLCKDLIANAEQKRKETFYEARLIFNKERSDIVDKTRPYKKNS